MNTPKPGQAQHTPRAPEPLEIDLTDHRPGQHPGDIEVMELVVEEEIDVGCDPYNSTGQQVIIEIIKDKEAGQ